MESDSKLHRGVDRLNSLPEELVLQILRRLPTKSAVAVAATVKRWYQDRIWNRLAVVDLDQNLIFHVDNYVNEVNFCRFVDRILTSVVPPIKKFKLYAFWNIDQEQVTKWIAEAVLLYPVEIELDSFEDVYPPENLLTCKTVETLIVKSHLVLPSLLPTNLLPSLHSLTLHNHFHDNFVAENIFQKLPLLRDLFLEGTVDDGSSVTLKLLLPRLERLHLSLTSIGDPDADMDFCQVVIDTPRLEHVTLHSDFAVYFVLVDSPAMVTARLRLGDCTRGIGVLVGEVEVGGEDLGEVEAGGEALGEEEKYALSVFKLLSSLTSVHSLSLSSPTRYVLNVAAASGNTLPTFPNLTRLELGISYCCGWFFPSTVFRDSPSLKRIVISGDKLHGGPVEVGGMNWQPPAFLPISLKEVEILNVDGYQRVRRFVEHLVTNANGLKRLVFGSCELSVEQEDLLRSSLAGRGCEVIVTR